MYNFPDSPIPLFFPVTEGALLQPWFSLEKLDQGLQLIRERKIGDFHCIRNATGALVDGEAPVILVFEKNTRLHQGFAIKDSHCSMCRRKKDRQGCAHEAALAILSLTQPASARAVPVPLGFGGSDWLKIGTFLFEWLNKMKAVVRQTETDGRTLIEMTSGEGLVRAVIPSSFADRGKLLLARRTAGSPEAPKAIALLDSQLQLLTMTPGEVTLAATGNSGIGWQRDSSFWHWLARMLYLRHGDTLPALHWNGATSRFSLNLGSELEPGSLTIVLPPEKTWELVKNIPLPSAPQILPPARECYRAFFNDENRLEVIPSLRLTDGRILSRQELAPRRFSSAYYLDGEGFLPVNRLAAEGIFKNPAASQAALPLLGFLQNEKTRASSFTVAANDIPAFLAANSAALSYPDNIVQEELRDLQIADLPDSLLVEDFEEEGGWCYLSCRYGLGNTSLRLADIAAAKKQELSCLPGRRWLKLDGTPLSWLYDLPEDRFTTDGSDRIRLSYREMLHLAALVPQLEARGRNSSLSPSLSRLLDPSLWSEDGGLEDMPAHLRPYQRNGLAWLSRLDHLGIGGLLADDMGLGKTHQGLALLRHAAQDGDRNGGNLLVICPASVLLNWAEKIDSFYSDLDYAVYYGPQRDLPAALTHRLVLTTYGIVRQDLDLLQPQAFDIILLDEIQHLKNPATAAHRAVRDLNGRIKIGLTGTPVENSLQDLRSLFDICLPGLLGSERQFERLYAEPISEGKNREVRDRLGRLIHPFILRRSRSQVLTELPPVIDDDRVCDLSDDQIALYREVISESGNELEELIEGTGAIPYMNILAVIARLKQICCHPCLVQGCDDPGEYQSGKWDLFIELAEELLEADLKFVVFSQYTGMLDLIESHLKRLGVPYGILKGDMAVGKRQKMIERFNTDPDCRVFCASLLAGGIGIDLTAARAVIHYDRWWNPAREEQATARVHRMGQKEVVQVFRLITKGTLEEKIHRLITAKRELVSSLIQEDEAGIIKQFDRRQLAELLRL